MTGFRGMEFRIEEVIQEVTIDETTYALFSGVFVCGSYSYGYLPTLGFQHLPGSGTTEKHRYQMNGA